MALIGAMFSSSCDENYDLAGVNSPEPGILRVYIKANDADNQIIIVGDTLFAEDSQDSISLIVAQGRAYTGTVRAILYKGLDEYRELTHTYNMIKLEDGAYKEHLIYESYLAPAIYDSFRIAISADFIAIGPFNIEIDVSPDLEYLHAFHDSFEIQESRLTEIHLIVEPFKSLLRVKDTYQFQRLVYVDEITQPLTLD